MVQAGFNPAGTLGIALKEIQGTVRIELKSLIPRPPLIGAVFVAFLESPHMEFELTNLLNVIDATGKISHLVLIHHLYEKKVMGQHEMLL